MMVVERSSGPIGMVIVKVQGWRIGMVNLLVR